VLTFAERAYTLNATESWGCVMPESMSWNYSLAAAYGPAIVNAGVFDVDAYQKLSVRIAAGATQAVTIAPGTWADVRSVAIAASDSSGSVEVTPDGAAAAFALDGPLFLIGAGAVGLLGSGDATLSIENTGAGEVSVDIFVTRDATP
jgi:hypothetical protein